MRLAELRVDGFGILNNLHLSRGDLAKNITVIHGMNEAGKSTLMEFFRAMLFGFKTRDRYGREPLRGGRLGGHLVFLDEEGKTYRVERVLRGRQDKVTVTLPDGTVQDELFLKNKILYNITPLVFRNVFAFGVDELRRLDELGANEVGAYVYGVGAGIRSGRLTYGLKRLQEELNDLFKPGGSKPKINHLLKELEDIEVDVRFLQKELERYEELQRLVSSLRNKRESLEEQKKKAEIRRNWLDKVLKARESWICLLKTRSRLEGLTCIPSFPESGLERLQVLEDRMRDLILSLEGMERRAYGLAIPLTDWPLAAREQALDFLETGSRRLSMLKSRNNELRDHLLGLQRQKAEEERELGAQQPRLLPRWLTYAMVLSIAAFTIAVFSVGVVQGIAALLAGVLVVALVLLTERRTEITVEERLQRLRESLKDLNKRIEGIFREIEHLSGQEDALCKELKRAAGTALGKSAFAEEEIPVARRALDGERRVLSRAEVELEELHRQKQAQEEAINVLREEIRCLMAEGGASEPEEFRRRAQWYFEGKKLIEEIRTYERDLNIIAGSLQVLEILERELAESEKGENEEEINHLADQIKGLEKDIREIGEKIGRLEGQIRLLENGEELAARLQEKEMKLAALKSKARDWQARAICLRLLNLAKERHERQRQPAVLRRASQYIDPMTEGIYAKVIAPVGRADMLQVETPDGARVAAASLSRGAASQLYLSVRLALAHQYESVGLPVILDDILVDFDPLRLRGAVRVLGEFGRDRQVILFTCHDHVLEAFGECLDGFGLIRLESGMKVSN